LKQLIYLRQKFVISLNNRGNYFLKLQPNNWPIFISWYFNIIFFKNIKIANFNFGYKLNLIRSINPTQTLCHHLRVAYQLYCRYMIFIDVNLVWFFEKERYESNRKDKRYICLHKRIEEWWLFLDQRNGFIWIVASISNYKLIGYNVSNKWYLI
jgi:hypothetical protein